MKKKLFLSRVGQVKCCLEPDVPGDQWQLVLEGLMINSNT